MEHIFKLETTEQTFQTGVLFTTTSLAESLFFSRKLAQKQIKLLRDAGKLVIVDYVKQDTFGGKPSPVYAWKWDETQTDVTPESRGKTTAQRLKMAYERRREIIKRERDDALRVAKSDEERERLKEEYDERLNELQAEKAEADKRRQRTKNLSRDLKRRIARVHKDSDKAPSLLTCWSQPVL